MAADNLKLGHSDVTDPTNPVDASRALWRRAATSVAAPFIEIEMIRSDLNEHKQRIETRKTDILHLQLPTWKSVLEGEYHQWKSDRVVVDTAGRSIKQSQQDLMNALSAVSI